MRRFIVAAAFVLVVGCGPQHPFNQREEKVTPAVVAQLGAPVYPGARASKTALRQTIVGMDTIAVDFQSRDSVDKIIDFYRHKVPANTGAIHFTVGSVRTQVYRYYANVNGRLAQVQITIVGALGGTTGIGIVRTDVPTGVPTR